MLARFGLRRGFALARALPVQARCLSTVSASDAERAYIPTPGPKEEMVEAEKWKYITFAGLIGIVGMIAYTFSETHHMGDGDAAPFRKIRKKDFPWGPCDLFDTSCKEAYKKAMAN